MSSPPPPVAEKGIPLICCSPSIAQTLTTKAAGTMPGDTPPPNPTGAEIQSPEHKKPVRPNATLHKKLSTKRLVGRLPVTPAESPPSQSGTESVSRASLTPVWQQQQQKETQSQAAEENDVQKDRADQPADQQGASNKHHLLTAAGAVTGLLEQLKDWAHAERERQKTRRDKKAAKKIEQRRTMPSSAVVSRADGEEFGEPLSLVSSGDEAAQAAMDAFDALVAAAEASHSVEQSKRSSTHRKGPKRRHARHTSDTDYAPDGEPVVPSCEEVLQTVEEVGVDEFKSQVLRLAHTLRCKGWRRVALDRYKEITVERISGAFTNVVSYIFFLLICCPKFGTPWENKEVGENLCFRVKE